MVSSKNGQQVPIAGMLFNIWSKSGSVIGASCRIFLLTGSQLDCGMMLPGNGSRAGVAVTLRGVEGSYSAPKTTGRPSASVPTAVPDWLFNVNLGSSKREKSPRLKSITGNVEKLVELKSRTRVCSRSWKKKVLFLP